MQNQGHNCKSAKVTLGDMKLKLCGLNIARSKVTISKQNVKKVEHM